MNLYELSKEFNDFEFEFDEETGEVLNDSDLDNLEMELNKKITNCIYFYKNKVAEAEALKAEKLKLADRQRQAEKQASWMKDWLAYCLKGEKWTSDDKVQSISYRKSDELVVKNPGALDKEWLRFKDPEVDKAKIKKALKAGTQIEGCSLVEKQNIQIK